MNFSLHIRNLEPRQGSIFLPGNAGFDVLKLVVGGLETRSMAADDDAGVLVVPWFFVTNRVLAKNQVMVVASNDNGGLFLSVAGAVVQHDVSFETVAMGAGFGRFFAKLDSGPGIGDDAIVGKLVVRTATTD